MSIVSRARRHLSTQVTCVLALISLAAISTLTLASTTPAKSNLLPVKQNQPLEGTLFFTDTERQQLDRARARGTLGDDGPIASPSTQVDGVVRHPNGSSVYWVNGEMRVVSSSDSKHFVPNQMIGSELRATLREADYGTRPVQTSRTSVSRAKKGSPQKQSSAQSKSRAKAPAMRLAPPAR